MLSLNNLKDNTAYPMQEHVALKILIVSPFFPPLNSIASMRPHSWAKHWTFAGHDVTVLTTEKWPQPTDSPLPNNGFRIITRAIPGIGLVLRILGMTSPDSGTPPSPNPITVGGASRSPNTLYRILDGFRQRYGFAYGCRMPDYHDLWALRAYSAVADENWDVVISSAWPYSAHWIGYRLRRSGKTHRWIADWRDLWTDNPIFPGLPGLRWLERRIERQFCVTADRLTTVSDPLADTLRAKFGDKVTVVYNGFDPDDYLSLLQERVFTTDQTMRIVHTGTMHNGLRDPTPLFRAVRQLYERGVASPDRLELIFAGSRGDPRELARSIGVDAFVRYLGFRPRSEALRMQRDADALLFLELSPPNNEGMLSGKLFEYLFAGPPILVIGAPSGAGHFVESSGRGWVLGQDIDAIAGWIEAALAGQMPTLPTPTQSVTMYTRQTQAQALLALIESTNLR